MSTILKRKDVEGPVIGTIPKGGTTPKGRANAVFIALRIMITAGLLLSLSREGHAQNMVLDWNDHATSAIIRVAAQPPARSTIRLAMVHVAIYDAVNAIEGYPFAKYAVTPHVVLPASAEAAAATAAHDMLVFP